MRPRCKESKESKQLLTQMRMRVLASERGVLGSRSVAMVHFKLRRLRLFLTPFTSASSFPR